MHTRDVAERIRHALLDAALQAHDDAGFRGLCAEGRWEAALDALRSANLEPLFAEVRGSTREDDAMKKDIEPKGSSSPARLIDARIEELGDWRGRMLSRLRALIRQADPDVTEEWKWRGVPVWSHDGLICTGETYKAVVKLTFFKGASLADPSGLFNSSLDGSTRRAIDLHEGGAIDEAAFKALIRAAVSLNASPASAPKAPRKAPTRTGGARARRP